MKEIKFVVIGESRIGKTCLINQYLNSFFDPFSYVTTGKDISYKELKINEKNLILKIWDFPGLGLYRAVNKIFLKNTQIALLVYDITDQNSFDQLNYWINEIKELNNNNIILGIAANKIDLFKRQVISNEEGEKFAKDNNSEFFETSAQNYESIEKVFNKLGRIYIEKLKEEEEEKKNNDIQTNNILNTNSSFREYKNIKYKNGNEYKGYLKNDKKDGTGKLKIKNGEEYDGTWSNDNFIEGKVIYTNGDIYDGKWENNCIFNGKIIYKNGNLYNGNCVNNKKEGDGIMVYLNGDKYDGNWYNDKRNGNGILTYKNGNEYNGNWINDIKQGKGKLTFSEGYYDGEWKNNELNGYVKIYYNDGKRFEGFFINGKREGNAKIVNENISYLNLKFENDISNEKGEFIFNNGRIINGTYDNNYNLIKGILKFPNGDIYEGEFDQNGKMKGKGIMKYNNHEIYNGEWDNDNKNGKGLLYINEEDLQIINNNNFNIENIFNLKLKSYYIYKGSFLNDVKEGNGILFLNNNNNFFENNTIFKGEFKDNKKFYGCLYYNDGSNLICHWKDDNNIDETELGIFNLNNSIKIERKFNTEEWINYIRKEQLNYYGIQAKNAPLDIIIR